MTETKALVPIPQRVEVALRDREESLRAILPATMPVARFMKTAVIAIAKNPDLQRCTFESLIVSIMEAAEAGIEPTGSLSRGWLVPFREKDGPTKAQLIIGWMGLIDLARDSGDVSKIVARIVYEGDDFTVEQGSVERITHVPKYQTEDPTKIVGAYAVATLRDGNTVQEVMTKAQVDGVRAKAKAKNGPAWTGSYDEMARKTVVRRLVKYLPLTPKARHFIERDDEREFGDIAAPPDPTARTQSLKESLREQAAGNVVVVEVNGEVVETPVEGIANLEEVAEGARVALTPEESARQQTKCGALSDPALGEIEECNLAAGHLDVKGSQRRHRAASGSIWPAT